MDGTSTRYKHEKKLKESSVRSQEEQHIEEKPLSTDNIEDLEFSSPTSAPPKLYSGSLFLYGNDPFGCFTNENQISKEDQQYNKFFSYMKTGKEDNRKVSSYSQGDIDTLESRDNFSNPINEAKSDLDMSDFIGQQSDSRLSPDPATNKAIIDIFDDNFSIPSSNIFNQESNLRNMNNFQTDANKQVNKNYKRMSPRRHKENYKFPQTTAPVMVSQMTYMQSSYMSVPSQPFMMGQNYGFPLNDTGFRRVNQYQGGATYPYNEYSNDQGANAFGNKMIKNNNHNRHQEHKRDDGHKNGMNNRNTHYNQQNNRREKKQLETRPVNDSSPVLEQGNQVVNVNLDSEELNNLIQNAAKLAKDQAGCRMLQKEVETENREVVNRIFEVIIDTFGELMVDPFGNYLCQKITEICDNQQMKRIIQSVSNELPEICFNPHGTRAVQKLIEVIDDQELIELLVASLSKDVVGLVKDNNGNHVIQKCLTSMSDRNKQFIYDSVVQNCVDIAIHKHGCCVIQRCLDYASKMQKSELTRVIAENAFELVKDQYGNYVVQYVLEMKDTDSETKQIIADKLSQDLVELSKQKFSSNVVEKCLQSGIHSIRQNFMSLMTSNETLIEVICDKFANYVLQRFLANANEEEKSKIFQTILSNAEAIKNDAFGGKIFTKLCKNYNLQDNSSHTSNQSNSPLNYESGHSANRQAYSKNDHRYGHRKQHSGRNDRRGNDEKNSRHFNNQNQQGYMGQTNSHIGMYSPPMGSEMMPPPNFVPTMIQPNFFMPQPQMYNQYYNFPSPQQGVFYTKMY